MMLLFELKGSINNGLRTQPVFTCSKLTIETLEQLCSKLTIKAAERRQWHRSDVFIVKFEHISHLVLVFLLLSLNMKLPTELSIINET